MTNRTTFEMKGLAEARRRIADLRSQVLTIIQQELKELGEEIMTDSKEIYCPVVTGTLKTSGYVEDPKIEGNRGSIALGYGGAAAAYALAVHENPRTGKTGGFAPHTGGLKVGVGFIGRPYKKGKWSQVGQWKFLETPFKLKAPTLGGRLAERIKEIK